MTPPSQYEARIVLATLGYTDTQNYHGTEDEQELIHQLDDALRHQHWADWVRLQEIAPGVAYAVFLQAAKVDSVGNLIRLFEYAGLQ